MNLIATACHLLGLFLLFVSRDSIRLGWQSRRWPHTQGIVTHISDKSYTLDTVTRQGPRIVHHSCWLPHYRYEVDGVEYESTGVCFGGRLDEEKARFKQGGRVSVYYDPQNPANAVLLPSVQPTSLAGLAPIGAGLLVGFFGG
ncbi:MAG TPA: hypothetical protein DIT13_19360 [Verrucomicrobiales bacterium]|nr:hypothetical protein [Verrucomicrobiales bacterium]HRJ10730.1 DUF3592 domain-containing protein [Prosthecobacter sp.]HRK16614.1 DUF3592 domain-containing protein [Prosthecobacter sp.]